MISDERQRRTPQCNRIARGKQSTTLHKHNPGLLGCLLFPFNYSTGFLFLLFHPLLITHYLLLVVDSRLWTGFMLLITI